LLKSKIRPEKDHSAQLQAFAELLHKYPQYAKQDGNRGSVRLVLIGGSRNEEDARRVAELRKLAKELKIEVIPLPFPAIDQLFS
jgi:alpha-1,2-mannosyltransferase